MTLKQLEYFYEIALLLNYSKAAEKLYITQSALSKQIHLLEEELHIKLFERNTKYVTLTVSGTYFLTLIKPILNQIQSIPLKLEEFKQGIEGEIRLGYLAGIERSFFLETINTFYQTYPHIHLVLERHRSSILEEKLLKNEFDLIITRNQIQDNSYTSIPLISFQLYKYKAIGATNTSFIELTTDIDSLILTLLNHQNHVILPDYVFNHSPYLPYLSEQKLENQFQTIYLCFKSNDNPLIESFITFIINQINMKNE